MPTTLSVSYGEDDAPYVVEIFLNDGTFFERLGFETRQSLAIFFENGATMATDRYYRVKHQPREYPDQFGADRVNETGPGNESL